MPRPTPEHSASPQHIDAAVDAFYRAQVEHARLVQHLAVRLGINAVDLRAIKFLGITDEGFTPKELGRYLGMGTSSITALIDRLVDWELVNRNKNPRDGRSTKLLLTDGGLAIVARLRGIYSDALTATLPQRHAGDFVAFNSALGQALAQSAILPE